MVHSQMNRALVVLVMKRTQVTKNKRSAMARKKMKTFGVSPMNFITRKTFNRKWIRLTIMLLLGPTIAMPEICVLNAVLI